jgi:hypothetical protein
VIQVRLWSGVAPPFGKVPLACIEQSGIAAAGTSVTATAHIRSPWVGRYGFVCVGDQLRDLEVQYGLSFTTTNFVVAGSAAANVQFVAEPNQMALWTTAAMRVKNNGGANMATAARCMGLIGVG